MLLLLLNIVVFAPTPHPHTQPPTSRPRHHPRLRLFSTSPNPTTITTFTPPTLEPRHFHASSKMGQSEREWGEVYGVGNGVGWGEGMGRIGCEEVRQDENGGRIGKVLGMGLSLAHPFPILDTFIHLHCATTEK